MHTVFKVRNLKDGDYWEDLDINERIILKWYLVGCLRRV
jgi:hypothetical protein